MIYLLCPSSSEGYDEASFRGLVPVSGEMGKGKEDGHQVDSCIPTAHMYQCQHPKRCNAQKDVIKVIESVRELVGG